jgi:hypothetical protein
MNRSPHVECTLVLVFSLLLGCGGGLPVEQGVIVKGKVLQDGQPLNVGGGADMPPGMEEEPPFEMALVPEGGGEAHLRGMYYGEYSASDGTVVFTGPGKGIPPGNYVLTVTGTDSMPGDALGDPFQGKFLVETSPFTVIVPPDKIGEEYDFGEFDLSNPPQ